MTVREKLASVKTAVSIVDVLKSHNIFVPAGVESQIRCPFHGSDSHPSARVYTTTNTIFCWTCHRLWDVIAAEMQFTGATLVEAVDSLCSSFSVDVQAQPQEIARFYSLANKYQRGDARQASVMILDLADRFRRYYTALP
jgi:DNA primase